MQKQETVRAFFRAIKVEDFPSPHDTIHLKVYYPAKTLGNERDHPQDEQAPFPVVIFFNGFNCSPEVYQWLAIELAKKGLVTITFAWVSENLPGVVALTPGVDTEAWLPENYGKSPTAIALPALLKELENLQENSILSGLLDLEKVILGGHSAGGRIAIESASKAFYPHLAGAFSYAAHTAGGINLGYEPGTILSLPDSLPLLLLGGTRDGVIANSANRYGVEWTATTTPILRTFNEAFLGGRKDSYFVCFEGANHFAITYPHDSTTGSSFLDFSPTESEAEIRSLMSTLIGLFIKSHICQETEALNKLKNLLKSDHRLISRRGCK